MIAVAVADDQALIRGGFAALVDAEPDMTVVGQAATGRDAVALVRCTRARRLVEHREWPHLSW